MKFKGKKAAIKINNNAGKANKSKRNINKNLSKIYNKLPRIYKILSKLFQTLYNLKSNSKMLNQVNNLVPAIVLNNKKKLLNLMIFKIFKISNSNKKIMIMKKAIAVRMVQ